MNDAETTQLCSRTAEQQIADFVFPNYFMEHS